jgi:hypothetical protein
MDHLRLVLAPPPRAVTPERVAVGVVTVMGAAAAAQVLAALDLRELREQVGVRGTVAVVTAVTALLSALVGRSALRARTLRAAHVRLIVGAALGGVVDVLASYGLIVVLGPAPVTAPSAFDVAVVVLGLGAPLGAAFGVAFSPVIAAAVHARRAPSLDGIDRVLFAAGASIAVGATARALGGSPPAVGWEGAAVAGALTAAFAGARLLARVRFLQRAREGTEPGFHVVPRSGREDERALVPLVRTGERSSGVLAATGASAPYRGERGVFRLALAPLPEEPFERPVLRLFGAAGRAAALTLATAMISAVGVLVVAFTVLFVCLLISPPGMG